MIEYVLCYAWSFTLGAFVGGSIVWYLFNLRAKGKI